MHLLTYFFRLPNPDPNPNPNPNRGAAHPTTREPERCMSCGDWMGYTRGGVYACTGCPGDGYALDDPDPNPDPITRTLTLTPILGLTLSLTP